jgi:outer membrane protein
MKKVILMALLLVPMSILAQKFGHFDSAEIMQAMPEYTAAQNEIQQLQTQYENDLKRMQDEFQTKYTEFQKEEANLLDAIKQRRMTELQEMDARIRQNYQDNLKSIQDFSQQKMQAISEKILAVIKTVGDEGGYVYIMDVTMGVPYISPTLSTDVTSQIKAKLGIQ